MIPAPALFVAMVIGVTEAFAPFATKAVLPLGAMTIDRGKLPTLIGAPGTPVATSTGVTVPGLKPTT